MFFDIVNLDNTKNSCSFPFCERKHQLAYENGGHIRKVKCNHHSKFASGQPIQLEFGILNTDLDGNIIANNNVLDLVDFKLNAIYTKHNYKLFWQNSLYLMKISY